ncbi:transposase [Sorangium cellulosum]|uniref:Transposase n=1 Tax=Sorangium cellulosum TaxID=56 RepID=A0A150TAW9_SORCE|nr:transposase [Sorangium cellulosum]
MSIEEQIRELKDKLARAAHERDEYRKLYELASIELERLRRHIYGQKAEHVDPAQTQLAFDAIVQLLAGAGAQPDAGATKPPEAGDGAAPNGPSGASGGGDKGRQVRPHGRQKLPEHLPVERIELLPPEARDERATALVRIGEEVSETLEWRPASFVRLQIVRPKFAVKGEPEQGVTIADIPDSPIPRCLAGPGLLAHVLVSKYADHLPLHRQEKIFERWGLHLSRSTLCGWVAACADKLAPLVGAMANDALNAHCIAIDATGVLVQAKDKCRRGHFWVLVADRDHVLFRYTPHHNQDGPKAFLRGYKGYVQADASNVYEKLFRTEQVTEVGCWAHARRKFFEAMTSDPQRATAAIGFIHKLYAIDKATKELPPSRRTEQRRMAAEPVLAAFRVWLETEDLLVLPRSPIAGAIGYALNQWTALTRFLEDGRLRLDNNRSELELRREAVGRKNWLFVGSKDGADWNATIVSLIASCALHGIEPWAYLRDVLILLRTWPPERVIELAPKSWKQTLEHADARQRLAASPWPRAPAAAPS